MTQIKTLETALKEKTTQVTEMEQKLKDSDMAIDVKLKTLEKHLATTGKRMESFVEENKELVSQLSSAKRELTLKNKKLEEKSNELKRVNDKIFKQESNFMSMIKEKDELLVDLDKVSKELKAAKHENETLRNKLENLQIDYQSLLTKDQKRPRATTEEISSLQNDLEREKTMNRFLNERLVSTARSGRMVNGFSNSFNTEEVRKEFDALSVKYKEIELQLEKEVDEKKTLISRLRFAETRLASASFDNQTLTAQLKKIKQLSKDTISQLDLEKELSNVDNFEANQEKMMLEIDFLKRQLTKEMEARKNAESVANTLHQKVGQIHRSDSAADIYKLRYEANEDYVKSLESRLSGLPLKDKTNVINGDIFKHRDSFEKYEEEMTRQRIETNRAQALLAEYEAKLQQLNLAFNKSQVTEASLRNEVAQLEDELNTVENQKISLHSSSKRYQSQYEESQKDLIVVENEMRAVKHGLEQAEKDIESMTQMIQKLRMQNKQKEQDIWRQETNITELEAQLDECTIELEKATSQNKVLREDLEHYKERARVVETNTQYLVEIDNLKGQLDGYLRVETELKKEISNLGYQLETLKLDSDAKIQDLIKQTQHYEILVNELGIQKDEAEANRKTLDTEVKTLGLKVETLEESLKSLGVENQQLQEEKQLLRTKLEDSNRNFTICLLYTSRCV